MALTAEQRRQLHDFYFGGLDYYRMAANGDHSQTLDPPKASLRSDDVDFQRGEVESGGRNIYFDDYSYHMNVEQFGCPPFTVDGFKDFVALASRLDHQSDPLSLMLWHDVPSDDEVLLKSPDPTKPNFRATEKVVVDVLNHIIELGSPCIYQADRFKDVSLRPQTVELMKKQPTGIELSRLNRLLLEDAYPAELSRN